MLLELPVRLSIALLLGLCAAGCDRQKPAEPQGEAANAAAPAPVQPAGVVDRSHAGQPAPDTAFKDPGGQTVTLAAFEGKPLLLNLWATWCAPCVAEMPALDALAGRETRVRTLAVSQDMEGEEAKVAAFFTERKLHRLEPYLDPDLGLMTTLQASNLPTTILFDSKGREIWRISGAADWASPDTAKLIAEAR